MISAILLDVANVVVPVVAIAFVFSIPLLGIFLYFQQKRLEMNERKMMIEKGIIPPPIEKEAKAPTQNNKTLQTGLSLLSISLGLVVGYLLGKYLGVSSVFSIGGSILFFLGVASLLQALVFNKRIEGDKNEEL
ncbi:MAG: hypothetical protein COA58_06205 [Bacteroidetes bacterium]|nr:MAG: hypothetical protein COA58_06205 [Bacteroidota bacterium]